MSKEIIYSPKSREIRISLHKEVAHIPIIVRPRLRLDPLLDGEELLVHEGRARQEVMLGVVRVAPPLGETERLHGRVQYVHVHGHVLF